MPTKDIIKELQRAILYSNDDSSMQIMHVATRNIYVDRAFLDANQGEYKGAPESHSLF